MEGPYFDSQQLAGIVKFAEANDNALSLQYGYIGVCYTPSRIYCLSVAPTDLLQCQPRTIFHRQTLQQQLDGWCQRVLYCCLQHDSVTIEHQSRKSSRLKHKFHFARHYTTRYLYTFWPWKIFVHRKSCRVERYFEQVEVCRSLVFFVK